MPSESESESCVRSTVSPQPLYIAVKSVYQVAVVIHVCPPCCFATVSRWIMLERGIYSHQGHVRELDGNNASMHIKELRNKVGCRVKRKADA